MKKIFNKQKIIFKELSNIINKHPMLTVFICHEYFRNLCPHDPYLKFKQLNPKKRVEEIQKKIVDFLKILKNFENYKILYNPDQYVKKFFNFSEKNKNIYFKKNFKLKKIKKNLLKRLKSANFNLKKEIKNKLVLDAGCGPGRFTFILSSFKCKKIFGIDILQDNIKIAKKVFKNKNIKYLKADVLNIPFKNETFDFVYSSGVVHHTKNMKKGIKELFRVCKKVDIFIYTFMEMVVYFGLQGNK